jgi:hypothetical protein
VFAVSVNVPKLAEDEHEEFPLMQFRSKARNRPPSEGPPRRRSSAAVESSLFYIWHRLF